MAAGKKTGGRQKGTVNKRTAAKLALVEQATSEGISPLEVMLGAMREAWGNGDKAGAANFAKDAAPYIHPKLSNVQHSGDADNPLETVTRIELSAPEGINGSNRTAPETHPGIYRTS